MNTEPDAIPVDEYHGQGGSYILDVKTGKRTRVEETAPASAAPAAVESAPAAAEPAPIAAEPNAPVGDARPKASVRRITPANADHS